MSVYIYPTDTVWGIGAPIYDESSCLKVDEIKKSCSGKPSSILFSNFESIIKNFDLPKFMDTEFLKLFFSFETTLGLPLLHSKMRMPKWIVQDSDWVGIRCLEYLWVEEVVQLAGGPVTTTSLNISGEKPCLDLVSSKVFCQNHCPEAHFVEGKDFALSGASSTIAVFSSLASNDSLSVQYLRKGRMYKEVRLFLESFIEVLPT